MKKSRRQALLLLLAAGWLAGCSAGLKIYPSDVPPGALRLGEVSSLASKKDIQAAGKTYEALLASGLKESELRDGSLGSARVFCCGGPQEYETEVYFYLPADLRPRLGDIVEIRAGARPKDGEPGRPNTATRIVQKRGEAGACGWTEQERFIHWNGVLYCDWMPAEHWTSPQGGNGFKVWHKPGQKPKSSWLAWPF